ncbi:uncharacterized protein LOC123011790 [Tribolium madens]|uniref:uncharacterized protein LOC123011790 n=1 Tax=Tribolium madens TaxID=41895 RepID=UPI001CF746DB|nr:uncharacterized protein LOC123011790 [Tribolium madens]
MVPSHHRVCMRMAHSVSHKSSCQHSISPDSDYQSPAGYCLSDCSCCCHAADRAGLAPRLSVILPRPNNQDRHIDQLPIESLENSSSFPTCQSFSNGPSIPHLKKK